jgi:hypothetical protein
VGARDITEPDFWYVGVPVLVLLLLLMFSFGRFGFEDISAGWALEALVLVRQ